MNPINCDRVYKHNSCYKCCKTCLCFNLLTWLFMTTERKNKGFNWCDLNHALMCRHGSTENLIHMFHTSHWFGCFLSSNVTKTSFMHLQLVSWPWRWVHCTQVASTVFTSQTNVLEREIHIMFVLRSNWLSGQLLHHLYMTSTSCHWLWWKVEYSEDSSQSKSVWGNQQHGEKHFGV